MDESIDKFINQLVIEAEVDKKVDNLVLEELKKDLRGRLENRINATILANIPDVKLEEFENLLDSGKEEELQDFCAKNITNFPEILAAEFIGFRNRYIASQN